MSVYFTHQSALAFWRRHREFGHCRPVEVRMDRYGGEAPGLMEVRDAAQGVLPSDGRFTSRCRMRLVAWERWG